VASIVFRMPLFLSNNALIAATRWRVRCRENGAAHRRATRTQEKITNTGFYTDRSQQNELWTPIISTKKQRSPFNVPSRCSSVKALQSYSSREPLNGRPTVLRALDPTGAPCILKSFALNKNNEANRFQRELAVLRKLKALRHPLLIPLNCVFIENALAYLEMPFYECGTLFDWLGATQRDEDSVRRVLQQICQAVSVLHREGILHRDLKLENVLMTNEDRPILTDFELSKDLHSAAVGVATLTSVGTREVRQSFLMLPIHLS
jgi:hypothetical protein